MEDYPTYQAGLTPFKPDELPEYLSRELRKISHNLQKLSEDVIALNASTGSDLEQIRSDIAALDDRVAVNEQSISALITDVYQNAQDIAANAASIIDLDARVTALENP